MAASADPLRNTLDHLALDPSGAEDRKYLVSMLRRLGYSEKEIQQAIAREGGERIIEIEYTGKGMVPRIPRAEPEPILEEEAFEVVAEAPAEFSFDEGTDGTVEEWTEEWPEDEATFEVAEDEWTELEAEPEAEPEQPEEELVDFIPREVEEEPADAWAEADGADDAWDEADETWDDAESTEWDTPDSETAWPEEEPAEARLVGFTVARGGKGHLQEGHVEASDDAWGEADEEWSSADEAWEDPDDEADGVEHTEPQDPALAAGWIPYNPDIAPPTTPPGQEWESADDAGEMAEADEHAWDDAEEAPDVEAAEEAVDLMPEAGYEFEDYKLYTRTVELSSGRKQRIYFFAKTEPNTGEPAALPEGYMVERNERTGLPFLRRAEASTPAPQPVVEDEDTTQERCHAVTQGGTQCKRSARDGAKYCGTHKGWRGPRVE